MSQAIDSMRGTVCSPDASRGKRSLTLAAGSSATLKISSTRLLSQLK